MRLAGSYKQQLKDLQVKLDVYNATIKDARAEARTIEDTIVERRLYLVSIEKEISNVVESGNMELRGLDHEATVYRQEVKNLKTEVRALKEDKMITLSDIQGIRDDFIAEEAQMLVRIESLQIIIP